MSVVPKRGQTALAVALLLCASQTFGASLLQAHSTAGGVLDMFVRLLFIGPQSPGPRTFDPPPLAADVAGPSSIEMAPGTFELQPPYGDPQDIASATPTYRFEFGGASGVVDDTITFRTDAVVSALDARSGAAPAPPSHELIAGAYVFGSFSFALASNGISAGTRLGDLVFDPMRQLDVAEFIEISVTEFNTTGQSVVFFAEVTDRDPIDTSSSVPLLNGNEYVIDYLYFPHAPYGTAGQYNMVNSIRFTNVVAPVPLPAGVLLVLAPLLVLGRRGSARKTSSGLLRT